MSSFTHALGKSIGCVRWAFQITRTTCPRLFVLYGLLAIVSAVIPAGVALSVRGLVNAVAEAGSGIPLENTMAYPWLLIGFAATLLGTICGSTNRYLAARLEIELRTPLQLKILRHHELMSFSRIEDTAYQDSLKRAQSSPNQHVANVYIFSVTLATHTIQVTSLLIILIAIEPLIFVLLLPISVPFLWFRLRLSQRQFDALDSRVQKERWIDYYIGTLSDANQTGEIKLLKLGGIFIGRLRTILKEFRDLLLGFQRFEFIGNTLFAVFSVVAVYLAFGHAVGNVVDGHLSIGDLAIFGGAAGLLRGLIDQGTGLLAGLRWQILNAERIQDYLRIQPDRVFSAAIPVDKLKGEIAFNNVWFRYPKLETCTLKDVSFSIKAGETVALVGENGSGKSTIAKLIAGLYRPTRGKILFDGLDGSLLKQDDLQRQIACIFQHYGVYQASASDNIAFGDYPRLDGDRDAIEKIARDSNVHEMILNMPEGYDTMLGTRFGEYQPSGGQWQQIAIARLIAQDARVFILDEPTANLDVRAERALFEQFQELTQDRTTIVISHRFSTVSLADRILVIDNGQLVESGTHLELMDVNGRYASLFSLAQNVQMPG